MTVLDSHPTLERLSSYLDMELSPGKSREIESHLEECSECRGELDGLRRVVGGLHTFERISPPPFMETSILQQVSLEAALRKNRRHTFLRLLEASGRGNIAVGFAVVFALAAIVYLFAIALVPSTEIVVAPPGSVRIFETGGVVMAEADGRSFRRSGTIWVEEGAEPGESLPPADEPLRKELTNSMPWLESLLEESDVVWLVRDGETVGLRGRLAVN